MNIDRRTFAKSFTVGAVGGFLGPWDSPVWAQAAQSKTPPVLARAAAALPKAIVTKVRVLTPKTGSNRNSLTAVFNQSNMIILVDTDAGITGVGEGGSPDLVASLAPIVIGRNALDTELIWQHMYMDPFYSPGREKIHALGGIDMALWDIKAKALNVPLYMLCGGKVREHVQLYATSGLPRDVKSGPSLKERAAATMDSGYYAYRVDGSIQPNPGFDGVLRGGGAVVADVAQAQDRRVAPAVVGAPDGAVRSLTRARGSWLSPRPPSRFERGSVRRETGRSTSTRSSTSTRPSRSAA